MSTTVPHSPDRRTRESGLWPVSVSKINSVTARRSLSYHTSEWHSKGPGEWTEQATRKRGCSKSGILCNGMGASYVQFFYIVCHVVLKDATQEDDM